MESNKEVWQHTHECKHCHLELDRLLDTAREEGRQEGLKMGDWNAETLMTARQEEKNRISALIEEERTDMKETHACRFNDGKNDCHCYLKALEALKNKINVD